MAERILIVEDDQGIANIHKFNMENLGLDVDIAYTAEEAYQKLKDRPDIVACDVHLVKGDHNLKEGYGIAQVAKEQGAKTVIQSASDSPSEHVEGVEIIEKFKLVGWVKKQLGIE